MFNTVKFFLVVLLVLTSSASIADNCLQSCNLEGRLYIDKSVSAEKNNLYAFCQLRCLNGCNTEGSIAEIAKSFKGKPDDYALNVCKGKIKADIQK